MPKTKYLPWLNPSKQPPNSILVNDYRKSLLEQNASSVTLDTGELFRNWEQGIYTINSEKSQVAMRWIGQKTITLSSTEFHLSTRNATVAIQSLDDLAISRAKNILISLASNSVPSSRRKVPFLTEPIQGKLLIQAPDGLSLYYATSRGDWTKTEVDRIKGKYVINLNKLPLIHWLRLAESSSQ
jgi:hypothetical protein